MFNKLVNFLNMSNTSDKPSPKSTLVPSDSGGLIELQDSIHTTLYLLTEPPLGYSLPLVTMQVSSRTPTAKKISHRCRAASSTHCLLQWELCKKSMFYVGSLPGVSYR